MRHVAPVRGALKIRTLFNVLGPLCNPAGVRRQVIGCFSASWLAPLAESLGRLGSERVWLLHGAEGYDELTLFGANSVVEWADGALREFTLDGETLGLPRYSPSDLRGGETASESADALRKVLSGARGSLSGFADTVVLNAAAAFVVAGVGRLSRRRLRARARDSGLRRGGRVAGVVCEFHAHGDRPRRDCFRVSL